jgi:hypothetical protein
MATEYITGSIIEIKAVLDVISVVKVTKSAIAKSIIIGGRSVMAIRYDATSPARFVALKAAAILKPAPNKNIILYGILLLSSIQSKILKGGANKSKPKPSNIAASFSPHKL